MPAQDLNSGNVKRLKIGYMEEGERMEATAKNYSTARTGK